MTFTATISVTPQRVCDMFVGAFEGGSNYWCKRADLLEPARATLPDDRLVFWGQPELFDQPFKIEIETDEGETFTLDNGAIAKGLQVMAEKYGRHFSDLVSENDDADTSDVFLQCCALGEVVYG